MPKIEAANAERKMVIVTGLPGAGKSTVVETIFGENHGFYTPDADVFKEGFVEAFAGGKGAGLAHKASTTVLKKAVMPEVLERGTNVIYQTTGGEETLNKIIQQAKNNNYTVEIVHVNIEPDMSMSRALDRFKTKGRFLDPYVTLGIYNEGSFLPNDIPTVMCSDNRLTGITVYDTNGKSPRFVKKLR